MSVTVNANVSSDVLEGATATFSKLGMSVADAVGMFLKRASNDPYMSIDNWEPNEETLAAMREGELGLGEVITIEQLWDVDDDEDDTVGAVSDEFMRRNEEAYNELAE